MDKDLFKITAATEKLNTHFVHMRTAPAAEPARIMANEIFEDFPNPDSNFIEQFQTTGYDSRIFELYLYAYFSHSGYAVRRDFDKPDFIINKGGITVALEATTINPSQLEERRETRKFEELNEEELQEKFNNEVPIRFGGPLFSKLNKRYWELSHCQDIPFVLAIEAFHEEMALYFSDNSLGQYLYGLRHFPDWTEDGHLIVKSTPIENHKLGKKVIPSNFFNQPNADYISAVIFSNSGTYAKFLRMGYQAGYHRGNVEIIRRGTCYDSDPDATQPLLFSYDLSDPPMIESWGNGLTVFHNPRAQFPIPKGYFIDSAEASIEDGKMKTDVPYFHPYMSQTLSVFHRREPFDSPEAEEFPVKSILKSDFYALNPARHPGIDILAIEKEWFADKDKIILGCLLLDRTDDDWVYVILGRDERGTYRWIDGGNYEERDRSREDLVVAMQKILDSGQKVFPQ